MKPLLTPLFSPLTKGGIKEGSKGRMGGVVLAKVEER